MIILGLTGSAAMGKSTVARMFRRRGVPVFDADRAVHALLAPGSAAGTAVARMFPGVAGNSGIDRAVLGQRVFNDPEALRSLERLLHPLVFREQQRFLGRCARHGSWIVVLDVPLLFESGGDADCDAVAVVSAPACVQRQRLLARPGMNTPRIEAILSRQMCDAEKRRRADYVIPTGAGRALTERTVAMVIEHCRQRKAAHWPPRRRLQIDRTQHARSRP